MIHQHPDNIFFTGERHRPRAGRRTLDTPGTFGTKMALKIVDRSKLSDSYWFTYLPREIRIVRVLSHPHVIATHRIVETPHKVLFLMELAANGDLHDYLKARGRLPENQGRYVFSQIADGVQYLHRLSIAHRDLKLKNILLDANMDVKIADFGLAMDASKGSACDGGGSCDFMAPEVIRIHGRYKCSVRYYNAIMADIWSVGVILYRLVTDRPLLRNHDSGEIRFPPMCRFTDPLKHLICSLLQTDPNSRLSCNEIARHTWMAIGTTVKPAQTLLHSPKYTIANLHFPLEIKDELNSSPSSGRNHDDHSPLVRRMRKNVAECCIC